MKMKILIVVDSWIRENRARSAAWREGFQQLVADVSMGRAGIVTDLEVWGLGEEQC